MAKQVWCQEKNRSLSLVFPLVFIRVYGIVSLLDHAYTFALSTTD